MSTSEPRTGTVVIGLGNPLMGDDGLGLVALTRLQAGGTPPDVELIDGGTWGMNLLPTIETAHRILFIDAIDTGGAPGTLQVLERHQLPRYLATKISPHQVDLRDVLAVAELRGHLPDETVAIGLQPGALETPFELSRAVQDRLDELVTAVTRRLATWGHEVRPAGAAAHA